MKFSVVLSVYHKEKPDFIEQSLISIINNNRKPSEIIIMEDGLLTSELNSIIKKWVSNYPDIIKSVSLATNQGLGKALNEGLRHCSNEWIFRMDTDDICLPDRFEKQIAFIQENPHISLIGSNTEEFSEDMTISNGYRNVACEHNDIIKLAGLS
ncbi:glycosyltransferase [Morganella morganii]|uniref:glycosyltransferase n=1 Tax=Morganella morganii TaxID=582 RepID=UPI003EC0C56D